MSMFWGQNVNAGEENVNAGEKKMRRNVNAMEHCRILVANVSCKSVANKPISCEPFLGVSCTVIVDRLLLFRGRYFHGFLIFFIF